jgi:hypothetical protein
MKKLSSLIIALFVLSAGTVFAQSSDNADITASATVLSSISVTGDQNIDFTNILPGVDASLAIDGSGNTSTAGVGGTPNFGQFTLSGAADASVELELTGSLTELSDGTNTLPATFGTSNYVYIADAATGSGNADLTANHTVVFDATGTAITVQLGGLLQPANNQADGTYTGTLTLTATQSSF